MGAAYMKKGADEGYIGDKYGFFLLTSVGTIRVLRMLTRGKTWMTKDLTWALNLK